MVVGKKTILVVDDEERTRRGLTKTLELWSQGRYDIRSAENGSQALELFQKQKIHLLITDVCMPEMDGLMLLKTIKTAGHKPVVLILSGYSEFEYAQEAIRLGVVNYLLKPINKGKLIEAMEQALTTEANLERADYMEKVADPWLLQIDSGNNEIKSPVIKEAIHYINKNVTSPITLTEIAEIVHLNPSYFSVLFKEQTRLTFSEFVKRKKLQFAKNLLLSTNIPIEEIAIEAGYQTSKYFIKLFKEQEGLTPSKFRKMSEFGE